MDQEVFDWLLLLARWLHITVGITWIGTSIFFMWLDRSFEKNPESKNPAHVGELWMVHGGGFYHVEKLLMGPTKVPNHLHWFKWESYWTWLSGLFLVGMIFYTGEGTFLLDEEVSGISFSQGIAISLFSLFGSWFYYDFLWERKFIREKPIIGHLLTLAWFVGMTYFLCHTISGRAAYIHIGGMLGTWMTANVFMRIIPRQIKMVEASKRGEAVNQAWGLNAKNRSTHNTYFTLPVIFIMLSNHFPATYGHELNWLILIIISCAGASIREYFIVRLSKPSRAKLFFVLAFIFIVIASTISRENGAVEEVVEKEIVEEKVHEKSENENDIEIKSEELSNNIEKYSVSVLGQVNFSGIAPKGKKLRLPRACAKMFKGEVYSDEVIVVNGKLSNVLVKITKGLEGKTFPDIPQEEVELDQVACIYRPRLIAARVGQKVTFINSDSIFHNVRSLSKKNKKFNVGMPKKGQRITKTFDREEFFIQAKCSVHPWMRAHVAIVAHPYFAVTKSDGKFEINDLPQGKYTLEAWHEVYGTQTQEIEINSEKNLMINFTYEDK